MKMQCFKLNYINWIKNMKIINYNKERRPPKLNGERNIADDITRLTKSLQEFNFNRFY